MDVERPDLSQLPPNVRAYVEALEAEVARLRDPQPAPSSSRLEAAFDPNEPPTPFSVITLTASGAAKRTPRHLYPRQRRGGLGTQDLEGADEDPPVWLLVADADETLLLISNLARAFRLPTHRLAESPARGPATPLVRQLLLERGERIVLALPCPTSGYLALVNRQGMVRRIRHNAFRETMPQGTSLYSLTEFGPPVTACLTPGDAELFIATRQGRAIRFAESQVPVRGCPGIRLAEDDAIVAMTAVRPTSGVLLLGADGRGTIRLMEGFSANKAPGSGGKGALSTEQLAAAVTVESHDDLFVLSRTGKLIRFAADEIPPKEGVVQGVHCMALRADEVRAVAVGRVRP